MLEAVVEQPAQRISVWICEHGLGPMRFPPLDVPEVPRWYARDDHRKLERISFGRLPDPVQEGPPDLFRLRRVQADRDHLDLERVIGPEARLFPPVIVKETLAVEAHKLTDQAPIRIIGRRLDREADHAEILGKVVQLERNSTDDAEGAASAAFQRPEEIGVGACVRDPDLSVSGDDFRLEQAGRRRSIVLRETSEAAALQQPREAHGRASTAL